MVIDICVYLCFMVVCLFYDSISYIIDVFSVVMLVYCIKLGVCHLSNKKKSNFEVVVIVECFPIDSSEKLIWLFLCVMCFELVGLQI